MERKNLSSTEVQKRSFSEENKMAQKAEHMNEYRMYINGQWIDSGDGKYIEVENPSNLEITGRVSISSEDQIREAADAADRAFGEWARMSPEKRAQYLSAASKIVLERLDSIAELMTREEGKPLDEARGEVKKGAEILQFYSEEAKRLHGERIPGFDQTTTSYVIYEPVGVAAAISPWNYPVELVAWKLGGALASGCTIIVKPPSETPLSPAAFTKCIIDAGVPAGVVNIVFGRGSVAGPVLVTHPKVKKVAFTGSTEAGKQVAALCGEQMKKVSLELGGHCPLIVTNKANLEEAVRGATRRSFRNMGQICIAVNRIYVQREIYAEFMKEFVESTSRLTIDDGIENPQADLGPMASKSGLDKTIEHISDALSKGAVLSYGGKKPEGENFRKGYYFMPTILSDTNHEMLIMKEETFGPAVGVMPFDTIEEAISLANDTNYGLATYVYTDDLHEADRFMETLETGNVAINNPDAGVINAPYGGYKESGMGYEHGRAGMMEYVKMKHTRIRYYWRRKS